MLSGVVIQPERIAYSIAARLQEAQLLADCGVLSGELAYLHYLQTGTVLPPRKLPWWQRLWRWLAGAA